MFATTPQTPFRQTGHYTPTHPSPLSSHRTPQWTMTPQNNHPLPLNIQTEPITRHQNHTPNQTQTQPASAMTNANQNFLFQPSSPLSPSRSPKPKQKYEARYASIANPMKNASGLARSKTRKMFLNRVRSDRDTGRFEARGEQMMHMEHLADRRRWEESMAREGEGVVAGDMEEDDMLPDDVDALDEFLSQEEAMEMALRETQSQSQMQNGHHGRVEQLRGDVPDVPFSDDDYDEIFMGLQGQSQDMDMS